LRWRPNAYRPKEIDGFPRREFGAGVHADVDAMARIGMLYLRDGKIGDRRILPHDFLTMLRAPVTGVSTLPVKLPDDHPGAPRHYGLLWWNNADGWIAGVPRDAYWSWGLYDSHIVVIPSLDLVVARAGKPMGKPGAPGAERFRGLVEPIVEAIYRGSATADRAAQ
jgi:CubicO group peptidase (beta-lactamase class C family)